MAFFRMKLRREQIIPRNGRTAGQPIFKIRRPDIRVTGHDVITVHEIKPGAWLNAPPQRMRTNWRHAIPTHVGYFKPLAVGIAVVLSKKHHLTRNRIETRYAPVLFGVGHQRLHTDANREHRFFINPERLIEKHITTEITNRRHTVAYTAHPGENNAVCGADRIMVVAHDHFGRSDVLHGACHRVQIAHAVVDHGDPLGHGLQHPFRGGADALLARIARHCHTQGPAKRLKHGLRLVMGIMAAKIIDM